MGVCARGGAVEADDLLVAIVEAEAAGRGTSIAAWAVIAGAGAVVSVED